MRIAIKHMKRHGLEFKYCNTCKMWYTLDNFYKDKTKWDNLKTQCKQCEKKKKDEYTINNRDKVLQKYKTYYNKNREKILEKCKVYRANNRQRRKIYGRKHYREINCVTRTNKLLIIGISGNYNGKVKSLTKYIRNFQDLYNCELCMSIRKTDKNLNLFGFFIVNTSLMNINEFRDIVEEYFSRYKLLDINEVFINDDPLYSEDDINGEYEMSPKGIKVYM